MFQSTNDFFNASEELIIEKWEEVDKLNPLLVNRLGYRDHNDLILDFIRAGTPVFLQDSQFVYSDDKEEYLENDFSSLGNSEFFEEISNSLDNLYDLKSTLEPHLSDLKSSSKKRQKKAVENPDFSPDVVKSEPTPPKGSAKDFSTEDGKVIDSLNADETVVF